MPHFVSEINIATVTLTEKCRHYFTPKRNKKIKKKKPQLLLAAFSFLNRTKN